MKHNILYSHGFWVEKTGRGLFVDISSALSDQHSYLFDYNTIISAGIEVTSFTHQVNILKTEIDRVTSMNKGQKVDLICHSQGCIIPTLLPSFDQIRRAIFIAPPRTLSKERVKNTFWSRPGVKFYENGFLQSIPRKDGTTTFVSEEYWKEFIHIDTNVLYEKFMCNVPTFVILAESDEILGMNGWSDLFCPFVTSQITIPGDHNFTGKDREGLILKVQNIFGKV